MGHFFLIPFFTIITVFITSFIGLAVLCKKTRFEHWRNLVFGILTSIFTATIGILLVHINNPKTASTHYSYKLSDEKQTIALEITDILKPNAYTNRYFASIKQLNKHNTSGKTLLSIPKDEFSKQLNIDSKLLTKIQIKALNSPLNPHQFNYKNYLKNKGIFHQIHLSDAPILFSKNKTKSIFGIAQNLRNTIINNLKNKGIEGQELAIISALLLGERTGIDSETYDNYKAAGAVHILAVSGLHVGILLLIIQFLLSPLLFLKYGRQLQLLFTIVLLWGFAIIAGLSPSIVRAVTMFSFFAYAKFLKRPSNSFNILALSMFFILLIKPLWLFDIGFQMSYAAVFSILWIYPLLNSFWSPKNIILNKIWQIFNVSIAAQLGVFPIALLYFHQFSGLLFISNLIILPFLGVILGFGLFVISLSLLDSLPYFLAKTYSILISVMNRIIEWIANQDAFVFTAISYDWKLLLATYLFLIFLVLSLKKVTFRNITIALLCIISIQGIFIVNKRNTAITSKLTLSHQYKNTAIFYQKGDSLFIFKNNNTPQLLAFEKTYCIAERINHTVTKQLRNSYNIDSKHLIIVDSLGIYQLKNIKSPQILLKNSPKINLDRLITTLQPELIIADGSNYPSYIRRWKESCKKQKLPFHSTSEKGAYIIK